MKKEGFLYEFKKNKALFAMAAPAFILVLVMQYFPMSGLILAFKEYQYNLGVFGSPFNGLQNFGYLFNSGTGWLITRNTILYNLLNLVTSQLLAVVIAIFITEIRAKYFKNGDTGACRTHSGKAEETDRGRICRACVPAC